jgi:hypothetical protein
MDRTTALDGEPLETTRHSLCVRAGERVAAAHRAVPGAAISSSLAAAGRQGVSGEGASGGAPGEVC